MSAFKLDENLPRELADAFATHGFSVDTVHDEGLAGTPDPEIVDACRRENRVLVTLDLDFADIRSYPPGSHPGIVVLRPRAQVTAVLVGLVPGIVAQLRDEAVEGRLWIVDNTGIRIRDADP